MHLIGVIWASFLAMLVTFGGKSGCSSPHYQAENDFIYVHVTRAVED